MVQLEALRAPSPAYNFIAAYADNSLMWTLNSNGFIDSTSGAAFGGPIYGTAATFSDGETITAGGLVVYNGESIASGDLIVADGTVSATVTSSSTASAASFNGNSGSFASNVLHLSSATAAASTFR
jgi:hypothetical protein